MADAGDPIDEAWSRLLASWGDPVAHRRFVGLCATLGRLPEAGRRYRQVRDGDADPERRAEAERQIDRLIALAVSTLETTRAEPPRRVRGGLLLIALLVTVSMIGGALWLVLR